MLESCRCVCVCVPSADVCTVPGTLKVARLSRACMYASPMQSTHATSGNAAHACTTVRMQDLAQHVPDGSAPGPCATPHRRAACRLARLTSRWRRSRLQGGSLGLEICQLRSGASSLSSAAAQNKHFKGMHIIAHCVVEYQFRLMCLAGEHIHGVLVARMGATQTRTAQKSAAPFADPAACTPAAGPPAPSRRLTTF